MGESDAIKELRGHLRHVAAARAIMKGVEAYNAAWSEIEADWREDTTEGE